LLKYNVKAKFRYPFRITSSYDLERLKNALIERTIYFKKFKKDKVENVVRDFKCEGYSDDFLKDLESGLRKSSIYHEN